MIRGIGLVYAKKLVLTFGEKPFDTIEAAPGRLRDVTGIGSARVKPIADAWAEQKVVREIMVLLHANDVGTARAPRRAHPCRFLIRDPIIRIETLRHPALSPCRFNQFRGVDHVQSPASLGARRKAGGPWAERAHTRTEERHGRCGRGILARTVRHTVRTLGAIS